MKNLSNLKLRTISGVLIGAVLAPSLIPDFGPIYLTVVLFLLALLSFAEIISVKRQEAGEVKGFKLRRVDDNAWPVWVWIALLAGFLFMLFFQMPEIISDPERHLPRWWIVHPVSLSVFSLAIFSLPVFSKRFTPTSASYVFMMMTTIVAAFRAMIWMIFTFGPWFKTDVVGKPAWEPTYYIFTFVLIITFMGDAFAYFSGRFFGKHKLAPRVSPKKTWEGAIGSFFLTTALAIGLHFVMFENAEVKWDWYITGAIGAFLMIIGVIGDLAFSAIKRYFGLKDFSNLIPGHGGILDRLDSLIFTSLAFYLICEFMWHFEIIERIIRK